MPSPEQTEKYIALKELSRTTGWKQFLAMLENREKWLVNQLRNGKPDELVVFQARLVELDCILKTVPQFLEEYESNRKQENTK